MNEINSVSSKKREDTRNNWVTFMFVCKGRYNCFLKQSHIDTCTAAFKELEEQGFKFDEMGFAGNHVHFIADVPKRYSISIAEGMLKSRSAQSMFEKHPGFRKRYPRDEFWSKYEHHQSTGLQDIEESAGYIRDQQHHHNIKVIDDRQSKLASFSAASATVARCGETESDPKGAGGLDGCDRRKGVIGGFKTPYSTWY